MNFNKLKKILLVLMLGIVAFLINEVEVRAIDSEFIQYTCTLKGSDTDIKVYVTTIGTLEFEATNSKYTSFTTYVKDGTPVFDYSDFKDGSCPNLNFVCSGSSCTIGCTGNECVDPAKEVDKPAEEQKHVDEGAGETCGTEKSKLSTLRSAISKLQSNINSTQYTGNARVGADWLVAYESGVTAREAEVKKALSDYETAYKNKSAKCTGLTDPAVYSQQYANLMDTFYKYSEKIKKLIEEAMANTTDDDELAHLQEELDKVNGVSNRTKRKITGFLSTHGSVDLSGYDSEYDCEGLLGSNTLGTIKKVLGWLKIAVPILLILLGSLDFGKAVLADDDKALSKATSTFIKRCIAAVAVFLAPYVIMYIIEAVDKLAGGCDISDLFNGVILWRI